VRALLDLIRNPPLEFDDDDGAVCDRFRVSRRERLEIMRPHWTYTILARELACGCTRRWWRTITLYNAACPRHGIEDWDTL
jgi:hypothetical protein